MLSLTPPESAKVKLRRRKQIIERASSTRRRSSADVRHDGRIDRARIRGGLLGPPARAGPIMRGASAPVRGVARAPLRGSLGHYGEGRSGTITGGVLASLRGSLGHIASPAVSALRTSIPSVIRPLKSSAALSFTSTRTFAVCCDRGLLTSQPWSDYRTQAAPAGPSWRGSG